jgi:hypothetical protein
MLAPVTIIHLLDVVLVFHRTPPDFAGSPIIVLAPRPSPHAGSCRRSIPDLARAVGLWLILADATFACRWPGSRSSTRTGLRDRGGCWAIISGDVSVPETVRILFLVGHPAKAVS